MSGDGLFSDPEVKHSRAGGELRLLVCFALTVVCLVTTSGLNSRLRFGFIGHGGVAPIPQDSFGGRRSAALSPRNQVSRQPWFESI